MPTGSNDTTASQILHVIYRAHFSRHPKNIAIPTMQIQCLNKPQGNYVRNRWAAAGPGRASRRRAEHTSATRHRRCGGRRRDLPRCRWAVAGPGRASRRRAERSSQRGRRAGGPPPTGTHSGRALRRPEHQRGHKHQHATRTARGRAAAHGRTKQPGSAGHAKQPGPQPGKARRSSPSEPCARAGASRPGRSGCGPRCAAPRLRCR